ncbi:MAG: hypothetical protein D6698_10395 [Gammaproteobacteria bacterium]|nr:MAG: hypothetical protein D6698_10395 [Gammaproteobacteria bacterium]
MGKWLGGLFAPIVEFFKHLFEFMINLRKQRRVDFEVITARYDALIERQEGKIAQLEQRLDEQARRIDNLQNALESLESKTLSVLALPWPVWIKLLNPEEHVLVMYNGKYEEVFDLDKNSAGLSMRAIHGDEVFGYMRKVESMHLQDGSPTIYFLRLSHFEKINQDLLVISWPIDNQERNRFIGSLGIPLDKKFRKALQDHFNDVLNEE